MTFFFLHLFLLKPLEKLMGDHQSIGIDFFKNQPIVDLVKCQIDLNIDE